MKTPLADRIRPTDISEVVGQRHLIGEGKVLSDILRTGKIPNMIFYGPSGTGKTTVANIAAQKAAKRLFKLNATNASVSDIKDIIAQTEGLLGEKGVLLYLDEIQNFNKKQQQSLLEFIENGRITLVASTTENPYFYIYNAILSRSVVFEFKQLEPEDILAALLRAVNLLSEDFPIRAEDGALLHIAHTAGGDARKALNALDLAVSIGRTGADGELVITEELAEKVSMRKALRYDRDGDSHYDVLSAFQKSIRGSDPDAALHYLARLVAAQDLPSICRRLLVMAAEDVGLAYPQAMSVTKACVDAALQLGFPEARIPLAQAVILLASSPKSNSALSAVDAAMGDLERTDTGDIPQHLKDGHYQGAKKLGRAQGYRNPHSHPNNYVNQQYLPDTIKDRKYYVPGNNKHEQASKEFWESVKGKRTR